MLNVNERILSFAIDNAAAAAAAAAAGAAAVRLGIPEGQKNGRVPALLRQLI